MPPARTGTGSPAEAVRTIFLAELAMLARDRRTVVVSLVLPLVVTPALLFGPRWVHERRERALARAPVRSVVVGSRASLAESLLVKASTHWGQQDGGVLVRVASTDPLRQLASGEVDLVVEALGPEESSLLDSSPPPPEAPEVPVLVVHYRADRDESHHAARRVEEALHQVRSLHQRELLERRGLEQWVEPVAVVERDLSSPEQAAGLHLGRYAPLFILLCMLSAGSVVAVDALAGEKERGTLETLLTTAASRSAIVTAKQLAITAVALFTGVIQCLTILAWVALRLVPLPTSFVIRIPPGTAAVLFILMIPWAAVVAGVLLLASGVARSYREAQLLFLPVLLVGMVLASAPLIPSLSLRSALVVVPVANLALALKDVLSGVPNWPWVATAWLVTAAAAWWLAKVSQELLSTERLILPTLRDEGLVPAEVLFSRRVLPAFALMWAVLFVFGSWAENALDLRLMLVVNLVLIFLGGSLLLVRVHRLPLRQVYALRPVHPLVWPLVVVGAPAGALASLGVFRLASLFLPVPPEILEAFKQALLPAHIPWWQKVFFLAILPGVCEELAFRGALLHGLRPHLKPVALAVAVGVIFGLFHVALFRLLPTAFLGTLLAGVVLLSGSIFPAMVWHTLNNAIGLWATSWAADPTDLPAWPSVGGALVLCGVFAGLRALGRRRPGAGGLPAP